MIATDHCLLLIPLVAKAVGVALLIAIFLSEGVCREAKQQGNQRFDLDQAAVNSPKHKPHSFAGDFRLI